MDEKDRVRDQIPEDFESIEEAADFWQAHSLADYWDETEEVAFKVTLDRRIVLLPLEQSLAMRLSEAAKRQGLSTETLANLWLSERLQQVAPNLPTRRVAESREDYDYEEHDDD